MKSNNIAIITARGGSKGIPNKNIKLLAGKPLIVYTIEAAKTSRCFNQICVTTDCAEIAQVAQKYNADIIERPKYLAQDNSSSLDVLQHALIEVNALKNNTSVCLLQPTSPFRQAIHIQEALEQFYKTKATALVSICEAKHSPFKQLVIDNDVVRPLFSWKKLTQARQNLKQTYQINGAIYWSDIQYFLHTKDIFGRKTGLQTYAMDELHSIDIDTPFDFSMAEFVLAQKMITFD